MIVQAAVRKNGAVHVGIRHHVIINNAFPFAALKGGEQGFITDTGIFLTREEAAIHAYECGQLTEQKKELYSEDLW